MLSIEKLYVSYGTLPVVQKVSMRVEDGEIVSVVGESGCGKSTMLQAILSLEPAASVTKGRILLDGEDLTKMGKKDLRKIRGMRAAMIFQNAALSMDPMKKISHLFYETVHMHRPEVKKEDCLQEACRLMEKIRLYDAERILNSYPFELSGGMCQRVAIAAAMMNHPSLILADEPTSALDVTAQAEVVRLMGSLREDFHTSMLVVTHNMGVAAQLADKAAVMYGGSVVEFGTVEEVIYHPGHPYTRALLKAVPEMNGTVPEGIGGMPREFGIRREGCGFAPRCPYAEDRCSVSFPGRKELSETHWIHCCVQEEERR